MRTDKEIFEHQRAYNTRTLREQGEAEALGQASCGHDFIKYKLSSGTVVALCKTCRLEQWDVSEDASTEGTVTLTPTTPAAIAREYEKSAFSLLALGYTQDDPAVEKLMVEAALWRSRK